jgi:hypothetical protein
VVARRDWSFRTPRDLKSLPPALRRAFFTIWAAPSLDGRAARAVALGHVAQRADRLKNVGAAVLAGKGLAYRATSGGSECLAEQLGPETTQTLSPANDLA